MPSLSTSSTQQPSPVRNNASVSGGMDEGNSPVGISASNITWENETNYSADSPIPPHLASTSLMSSAAYQQSNPSNYYQHSIYETETSSATTSARSSGIVPSSARSSGVIPSSTRSSGAIARTIPGLSALSLDGTGGRASAQSNNSNNSNSSNNTSNNNSMFSGLNDLKANSRIYQEQQLLFIMQNHFISIPIPSLRFDRIGSFSWNGINTLLYDFDDLQKSCHHINNFYLIDENKLKGFLFQHHLMRNPHSNAVSSNDEDFMNTFKFILPENSSMTLGLNSSLEKVI
jgi:hypothetical protein